MRGITRASGSTPRQVRHWEDLGLLGEVERSAGGWRLYERSQFELASEIAQLRAQGFSLEAIRCLTDESADPDRLETLAQGEEAEIARASNRADRLRAAARARRGPLLP